MVVKNLIHYLINKYLKNYVERLDYENLKLNLKNGNVLLEDLHLKPEALAYLNIPATVAVGYMEQLKLTIPWKNLNKNPTEVHINGLYILIVPKKEFVQDLSELYADKMKRVQQKLENLRKTASDNGKFDNKKDSVFVERMRLQIMQNLVFTIRNLHISYEMKSPTKLGHPFSFGITLHYLQVATVNDTKRSRFLRGNTFLSYKVTEINCLSIYWNSKCKSRLDMPFKDVVDDLKSKIATDSYTPHDEEMNYILRPVNLVSDTVVTMKPKENYYERSAMIVDIQVEQIDFNVDPKQISDVLDFIKFQSYTIVYDRCREYRKLLLQDYLDNTSLTKEQRQRIEFLETKLEVFHLAYIRYKLELEMDVFYPISEDNCVEIQQPIETEQTPVNDASPAANNNNRRPKWNSLLKVKNKLTSISNKVLDYRNLAMAETSGPSDKEYFFEDVPKLDIQINVNKATLNLLSTAINARTTNIERKDEILASVNIMDIQVNVKLMSISSRLECLIDLQYIQVSGMRQNKQIEPVLLIEMLSSFSPHVHAEFELFPLDQKSDYRLHMTVAPIRAIYDAPTLNRIVECFETNGDVIWRPHTEIKRRTYVEMERDYPYKKIFDLRFNITGILFFLPQCGVYHKDFSMVRVTLSNLLVKSCLDDQKDDNDNFLFQKKDKERQFYKKFKLEISDLRLVYSQSNKKQLHLLRRTPLVDMSFYKCVYSDDAILTKWRIGIKSVLGEIYLSKALLAKVICHFDSVPLFYSNIAAITKRINCYFMIFSPHTTFTIDLSLFNCCLRFLMYPQKSIRTDFNIRLSNTRDETDANTHAMLTLKELTMIRNILSALKQSSQPFYQNEQIKLIYSNSIAKL